MSLLWSLLPQPASFKKKRNYVLHEQMNTHMYGKVIRATWTKPAEAGTPVPSSLHHLSGEKIVASVAAQRVPAGESRDIALKIIPKKKAKGCENLVLWNQINILKGLDHKNIVS
jgi:calcium/calmodulin-dependent protein kinase I